MKLFVNISVERKLEERRTAQIRRTISASITTLTLLAITEITAMIMQTGRPICSFVGWRLTWEKT